MITNGIPFQFGPGASFRCRNGEVVESQPARSESGNLVGKWYYDDKGSLRGIQDHHEFDLIEQLTLPYEAKSVELAAGQVWEDEKGNKVRIVATDVVGGRPILGLVNYDRGCEVARFYDRDGYYSRDESLKIPQHPAVPKNKVVTKLWVYQRENFGISVTTNVQRSKEPLPDTEDWTCLGFVHGSEQEEE